MKQLTFPSYSSLMKGCGCTQLQRRFLRRGLRPFVIFRNTGFRCLCVSVGLVTRFIFWEPPSAVLPLVLVFFDLRILPFLLGATWGLPISWSSTNPFTFSFESPLYLLALKSGVVVLSFGFWAFGMMYWWQWGLIDFSTQIQRTPLERALDSTTKSVILHCFYTFRGILDDYMKPLRGIAGVSFGWLYSSISSSSSSSSLSDKSISLLG